jgi:hypothetical protein
MPTDCRLLDFIGRSQDVVGPARRTQGHEGGGFALGFNFRMWRLNAYERTGIETDDSAQGDIEQVNTEIPRYVGSVFAWNFSVGSIGQVQQRAAPPQADPLPAREGAAVSNALAALIKALSGKIGKNCQKNVIDKLAQKYGFGLSDFVSYLGKGANFYNGLTSQAPVAGTITTPQAANAGFGRGATIASVFNNTSSGLQTNALTSITSPTLLVFLRPNAISRSRGGVNDDNLGLLFHEGLHGYGGTQGGTSYFDQDLTSTFGLKGKDSGSISDHISRNCF